MGSSKSLMFSFLLLVISFYWMCAQGYQLKPSMVEALRFDKKFEGVGPQIKDIRVYHVGRRILQLPCMTKMMPCLRYLKDPSHASPACCIPLKEEVANDSDCLCKLFSNTVLLKAFNVSMDDALVLAGACGAAVDTSMCSFGSPTGSPATLPSNPTNNPSVSGTSTRRAVFGIHGMSLVGAFIFSIANSLF